MKPRIQPIQPIFRDPRGRGEWQEAADDAYTLLLIDSAKQYGLIEGGPTINVERCEVILDRAKIRGIAPSVSFALLKELM